MRTDRHGQGQQKKSKADFEPTILNRRARHDYHISDTVECGIQLTGTEVKSVRYGRVSLAEGFAAVDPRTHALVLYNVDIGAYPYAGPAFQHTPKRPRILLAHKREIRKLLGETTNKGVTLAPLRMYFVRGRVKVEIGLATGKQKHDKRQDLRKRDAERDMRRAMTRKVLH